MSAPDNVDGTDNQSATERLPCGHWKGDWVDTVEWTEPPVKVNELVACIPYCRICAEIEAAYQYGLMVTRGDIAQLKQEHQAEIQERTAAAMVAQREFTAKHLRDTCMHLDDEDHGHCVRCSTAFDVEQMPLASAPEAQAQNSGPAADLAAQSSTREKALVEALGWALKQL